MYGTLKKNMNTIIKVNISRIRVTYEILFWRIELRDDNGVHYTTCTVGKIVTINQFDGFAILKQNVLAVWLTGLPY